MPYGVSYEDNRNDLFSVSNSFAACGGEGNRQGFKKILQYLDTVAMDNSHCVILALRTFCEI
jgi:hypothetical protein